MFFFFNDTATTEIYTLSLHDALPILLGLGRVGLEPVPELLVADPLHEALDLGVAELGLGLALELRVADLHRDDRRQALADVLTRELLVLALEELLLLGVAVDDRGQRRTDRKSTR